MRGVVGIMAALAVTAMAVANMAHAQEIVGLAATPHNQSNKMRWRRLPSPELAARVELFLRHSSDTPLKLTKTMSLLFDGKSPQELLESSSWAWHDSPHSWRQELVELPPDCLTVIAFNGMTAQWGTGTQHTLQLGENTPEQAFSIDSPTTWLSAVTFVATDRGRRPVDAIIPNQIVVHVRHLGAETVRLKSLRLWLPQDENRLHVFRLAREFDRLDCFPADGKLHGGQLQGGKPQARGDLKGPSIGGFVVNCDPLPRSYAVVEVQVTSGGDNVQSLWSYLKIKPEVFDISGGWIASDINGRNSLTMNEYLQTLTRMHINTGQIEEVRGYTDNIDLYRQFPFKRFNRMQDLARYDTDALLPTIHAVEFIGEPQYGGGRPIPPQEVWQLLAPYQGSRLPTSVTLSEEKTWRYYAGLSDYPHYDAYRVIAPAADSWTSYDRWGGEQIRWGAPLETIGEMTRSLRELSRPRPIAYWSQGAHDDWGSFWNKRRRGSPTPDELRSQAWHGLANRVTSLYWFNLSLKSLVAFPDLIEPITRVNREIRMIEDILLTGDAFEYQSFEKDGQPDWEVNSVAAPNATLLVAHDVAYRPDPQDHTFQFQDRQAELEFAVPSWHGKDAFVFALNADGVRDVVHTIRDGRVLIQDSIRVVGIYLITSDPDLRSRIAEKHATLLQKEALTGFDPGNVETDLQQLKALLQSNP